LHSSLVHCSCTFSNSALYLIRPLQAILEEFFREFTFSFNKNLNGGYEGSSVL
jgi:hypothetical protein